MYLTEGILLGLGGGGLLRWLSDVEGVILGCTDKYWDFEEEFWDMLSVGDAIEGSLPDRWC